MAKTGEARFVRTTAAVSHHTAMYDASLDAAVWCSGIAPRIGTMTPFSQPRNKRSEAIVTGKRVAPKYPLKTADARGARIIGATAAASHLAALYSTSLLAAVYAHPRPSSQVGFSLILVAVEASRLTAM